MRVKVHFYSYFKELAGCTETGVDLPAGATLGLAVKKLIEEFPKFTGMQKSMLTAVGVEYQKPDYALKDGDEVSLFPPVQGG